MVTQEEIHNMVPTITIATYNMAAQIEDEPLPWYLVNAVIDTDTWEILQYKYLMQKNKKQETSGKWIIKRIWTTCRRISRKSEKVKETISFVARNNIPVGLTVTYSHILVNERR